MLNVICKKPGYDGQDLPFHYIDVSRVISFTQERLGLFNVRSSRLRVQFGEYVRGQDGATERSILADSDDFSVNHGLWARAEFVDVEILSNQSRISEVKLAFDKSRESEIRMTIDAGRDEAVTQGLAARLDENSLAFHFAPVPTAA